MGNNYKHDLGYMSPQVIELYTINKCIGYFKKGEMPAKAIDLQVDNYKKRYNVTHPQFIEQLRFFRETGGLEETIKNEL